jgi:hypothetical protein
VVLFGTGARRAVGAVGFVNRKVLWNHTTVTSRSLLAWLGRIGNLGLGDGQQPISSAEPKRCSLPVTSRKASSSDRGSTRGVNRSKMSRICLETSA